VLESEECATNWGISLLAKREGRLIHVLLFNHEQPGFTGMKQKLLEAVGPKTVLALSVYRSEIGQDCFFIETIADAQ
jgi:hypothetical protein